MLQHQKPEILLWVFQKTQGVSRTSDRNDMKTNLWIIRQSEA